MNLVLLMKGMCFVGEYQLFTDVTADLPQEVIQEYGIEVLHLTYQVGEETYGKDKQLGLKEFYDRMREGAPTSTAQIFGEDARIAFEKVLEKGKDILYIGFSSGLSGSFQRVALVAQELCDIYPERRIIAFDSLSASLGEGLFVKLAAQRMAEGMGMEELHKWLLEHRKNICQIFTVEDLKYLYRGGRVSKTAAVAGSLLGIKPVLHVDDEGHLVPINKIRGRKQSLINMAETMAHKAKDWANPIIAVSHGDCLEDANFLLEEIKKRMPVQEVIVNFVGPVIGSHSGPGTVALFFMGESR